jgi:hypothetical protein
MHKLQKILLARLVKKNGQTYSSLTEGYDFDDNIVYHLKKLIKKKYVSKRDGKYYLTTQGLAVSGSFDLNSLDDRKFKTGYIGFVCKYQDSFLLRSRNTQGVNFYKLPGGKPLFGVPFPEECSRLFKIETSLELDPMRFVFRQLHSKIQKDSKRKTMFDDILFVLDIELVRDEYKKAKLRSGNEWYKRKDIRTLKNTWPEINHCILKNSKVPLLTYEFMNDYHLVIE